MNKQSKRTRRAGKLALQSRLSEQSFHRKTNPHRLWLMGLLFLLALGVQLLYVKLYNVPYVISPDGLHYSNIAENFLSGHGLVNTANYVQGPDGVIRQVTQTREYVVGPVYPLLLALIYGIFGFKSYGMVVLVLHTVLGAGSALLAYKTGEILFGDRYAWIPYLLTLGYPIYAFWGMYVLTETTYVFVVTLFLYILACYSQQAEKPKLQTLLLLGLVLGIANLVRPLLLPYFPVLGLWIFWMKGGRGRLKRAVRDFSLIVLMTVLVMCPWWIRNALRYHQFIAVSNYGSYELYLGNNPLTVTKSFFYYTQPSYDPSVKARIDKLPVQEQETEYKKLAETYILQHPKKFVERTLAKEKNLFWQPISVSDGQAYKMKGAWLDKWYLYLGFAGVILSLFRLKKYSFLLLFGLCYSFVVSMITVVAGARYRLPVMPVMIFFASLVLAAVFEGVCILFRRFHVNLRTGRRI